MSQKSVSKPREGHCKVRSNLEKFKHVRLGAGSGAIYIHEDGGAIWFVIYMGMEGGG